MKFYHVSRRPLKIGIIKPRSGNICKDTGFDYLIGKSGLFVSTLKEIEEAWIASVCGYGGYYFIYEVEPGQNSNVYRCDCDYSKWNMTPLDKQDYPTRPGVIQWFIEGHVRIVKLIEVGMHVLCDEFHDKIDEDLENEDPDYEPWDPQWPQWNTVWK